MSLSWGFWVIGVQINKGSIVDYIIILLINTITISISSYNFLNMNHSMSYINYNKNISYIY